jgi:hypothetical protein
MIQQFRGAYGYLSNFAECEIEYNGFTYPSTEHAYMAQKSDEQVQMGTTPENLKWVDWNEYCAVSGITAGQVKSFSREVELRSDWNEVKLQVMEDVLRIKFSQEPFKSKLISTGDEVIQEGNYWGDSFWGVDLKTGKGVNHLGKLLMQIRNESR